jgi:MYXO-CTERM domain-containing protein
MGAGFFIREFQMLALAVTAACSACAAPVASGAESEERTGSTQQAITNGEDDKADSAIVALLQGGKVYCTGVLVTPTVVATAAHCVAPSPPDQIYFGSDPSTKKGTFIDVASTSAHPEFDEDTLANDVGVVGLAQKAPVAPMAVLTKDMDASYVGRPIRLVGFGAPSPDRVGALHKRTGTTTIESFGNDDFRFQPGPSQTCVGDSGGPALADYGDHEAVVGITSSGDGDCKTYGRDMRIDRYVPFIMNFVKAYSIPTGPTSVENAGCSVSSHATRGGSPSTALLLVVAGALAARARRRTGDGRRAR